MIKKVATFPTIPGLDAQFAEVIAHQFDMKKEVTATFTAADTDTAFDFGFKVDRWIVVDKVLPATTDTDMIIWRYKSPDDRYLYLRSSIAGTATVVGWKGGT